MIDNKDYNYTLVVTGQNFQILHHDTNRNLTYKHGLNVRKDIIFFLIFLFFFRKKTYLELVSVVILEELPHPSKKDRHFKELQN